MSPVAPLEGDIVVDLSSGIAGGYCTKVLADGGAEVIKVEPPDGDPLRRWSASGADLGDDDGALFRFLNCSKRSVVVDPDDAADIDFVHSLVRGADAVVWSRGTSVAAHPALSPPAVRNIAPNAVIQAITPFGLEGPWTDRPWTEATLQAWCGGAGVRGSQDRPPLLVGGRTGEWASGMVAAVGVLSARVRAAATGHGELLDTSMLEALVLTHTMYGVTYRTVAGFPFRPFRYTMLPSIHAASDGMVGFMVVTGQQWLDFCAMVGRPDWAEDESLIRIDNRIGPRRPELEAHIDKWVAGQTADAVVEMASLFRIPVAHVGNGATIPTFEQFAERAFYVENPRGGFLQPDVPYTLSGGAARRPFEPAPLLGEHSQRYRELPLVAKPRPSGPPPTYLPLEGIRVADFTAFWAGPIVGQVLGMLGADVVHVESPKRPDGMRFHTFRSLSDDEWWEWSPLYHGTNTNKRGLALDLQSERGQAVARDLIAHCDVLVENYSPRVMESWNLGYEEVRAIRPDIVMVRMPAFGLSGPWRDRVGYAQTMEQISGLAWLTGYPDRVPEIPNGPCDPIAGSHATIALLLALEHRRRTGQGTLVEIPMVGGALTVASEQVVEHSAYGVLLERSGNRDLHAAPQGIYRCADRDASGAQDRWIAISVVDDAQWARLRQALGDPGWASDAAYDSHDGRLKGHDSIDVHLAAWCAEHTCTEAIDVLWGAGVPVAKVTLPHEQDELEQLVAREFFQPVEHPVTGVSLHASYPVRFELGPANGARRPAPTLGQHNREILGDLLGMTEEEIAELESSGVIGTRPDGSGAAY